MEGGLTPARAEDPVARNGSEIAGLEPGIHVPEPARMSCADEAFHATSCIRAASLAERLACSPARMTSPWIARLLNWKVSMTEAW